MSITIRFGKYTYTTGVDGAPICHKPILPQLLSRSDPYGRTIVNGQLQVTEPTFTETDVDDINEKDEFEFEGSVFTTSGRRFHDVNQVKALIKARLE